MGTDCRPQLGRYVRNARSGSGERSRKFSQSSNNSYDEIGQAARGSLELQANCSIMDNIFPEFSFGQLVEMERAWKADRGAMVRRLKIDTLFVDLVKRGKM
ncbi:hypothetical protein K458DRAFT_394509 [Lentithecium fluviatile CBS 122367]|uniref:Uncharacterized protein n=1 Tax=Lentithecium fluviatile CBS 122367 TaxID=1168545 RepID=A0A6G1IKU0_9PLEO|nr:hypothetical protein K458DRAFT_394509 [Lentithecium fluviatile CBS 122367]